MDVAYSVVTSVFYVDLGYIYGLTFILQIHHFVVFHIIIHVFVI